jgi:hypothetical protein
VISVDATISGNVNKTLFLLFASKMKNQPNISLEKDENNILIGSQRVNQHATKGTSLGALKFFREEEKFELDICP